MRSNNVRFDNDNGETLAGVLDMPDSSPVAYALFAHCFTCSKNLKAVPHISRALTDAGIAVLRFDFTGLGQSEGDFAETSFSSNVSDLIAACRFLERDHAGPQILVGHSLGGTAVLQAAADIPSAVAVATIGSPASPTHVKRMFTASLDEFERTGEAVVELGGRAFRVKRQFVDDLDRHSLPRSVGALRRALLILHSPLDRVVGIDNAERLFVHARHPKSFVSLDKADHLLTREEDSRYVGRVLAAWAGRYLPRLRTE
jgi:putative redox protein